MILDFIKQLHDSFGLKHPVDTDALLQHYRAGDYYRMAGVMMTIFSIDLKLKLGLVNRGGPIAPAWLSRPSVIPPIYSPLFAQTEMTVYLRKSFIAESGFDPILVALAHEFSHIVLDATHHPLRQHEEAVDLMAMLCGFRNHYVTGTQFRVNNTRHRIGYLSQAEIEYAARLMNFTA